MSRGLVYADPRQVVLGAWADGLTPDPHVLPSAWSEEHRVLRGKTAREPGRLRLDRTPYLREILDCFAPDSDVDLVAVMKAAQLGFTEGLALSLIGYWIDQAPGSILFVQPSLDLARAVSKERIQPMLLETPVLRGKVIEAKAKDAENTLLYKEFLGGFLVMAGANSPAGLRQRSIRYLVLDERDAYPADVGGEGDPGDLARARQDAMEGVAKTLIFSTPTIRGFSATEREFELTDRRVYEVPCPHCGGFFALSWARVRWDDDQPQTARIECAHCEGRIEEIHKYEMLLAGRWTPTAEPRMPRARGYLLSGLYSPFKSWSSCVEQWIRAQRNREALKVFVNTVLAETWQEGGETVEADDLRGRRERYPEREVPGAKPVPLVPAPVLFLTAGVDVQEDRWELSVYGWGMDDEAWLVEHQVLYGDTSKRTEWESILGPALMDATWEHELGAEMRISSACIDSGYRPREVYRFCQRRRARRIFATKGRDGAGLPLVGAPAKRRTGKDRRPVELYIIGTDDARADVLARLRVADPGPRYLHVPHGRGVTNQVLEQLVAMVPKVKYLRGVPRRIWELKPGARKEALDCLIGATAAVSLLQPAWRVLERTRRERERARPGGEKREPEPTPEPASPATPKPAAKPRPRAKPRPSGWLNSWRR